MLTYNIQPVDKAAEDIFDEDAANDTIDLNTESDPGPPGHDIVEDGEIQRTGT